MSRRWKKSRDKITLWTSPIMQKSIYFRNTQHFTTTAIVPNIFWQMNEMRKLSSTNYSATNISWKLSVIVYLIDCKLQLLWTSIFVDTAWWCRNNVKWNKGLPGGAVDGKKVRLVFRLLCKKLTPFGGRSDLSIPRCSLDPDRSSPPFGWALRRFAPKWLIYSSRITYM